MAEETIQNCRKRRISTVNPDNDKIKPFLVFRRLKHTLYMPEILRFNQNLMKSACTKYLAISMLMLATLALVPSISAARTEIAATEAGSITLDHEMGSDAANGIIPNNTYYELLGTKMTSTMTFYVNPKGSGNDSNKTAGQARLASGAWNATTEGLLFTYGGLTTKGYGRDGQNTVLWANLPSTVIARTVIWTVPDNNGDGLVEVVEVDIVMNSQLKWQIDPDGEGPLTIKNWDIRNILTHEFGHVVGLADLTSGTYYMLTMHAHASKGETQNISLEGGDIAGAQSLYGARVSRI